MILIVVCGAVLIVHWPALGANALSYDDNQYLTENKVVQDPSWQSAKRFLTEVMRPSTVMGYYQPLSMISLMCDCAMGGGPENLMPFHRTSLLLHLANTMLVIIILYLLFDRIWPAAAVGLLFGLHPMTVEAIPWVGERKTLLAAFFVFWSLVFYVVYVRKNNWWFFVGSAVMYILGFMSKPTSMLLPFLLLLLDFWPLKRKISRRLLLEKIPFFAIGGIFTVIAYISQKYTAGASVGGGYGWTNIPVVILYNIAFYLAKVIVPVKVSSHYAFPQPCDFSNPEILAYGIGAGVLMVSLIISLKWTRGMMVGWLIFFIGILPTMQVVQFSNVIASDKFTYMPSIGLSIALAAFLIWLCDMDILRRQRFRRVVLVAVVLLVAIFESIGVRKCLGYWRETPTLFKYMIKHSPNSPSLYNMLGVYYAKKGGIDEAENYYRKALTITPNDPEIRYNLGNVLRDKGDYTGAIKNYRMALKVKPYFAKAYNNLAIVLKLQGKPEEAIENYRKAIELKSDFAPSYYGLAGQLQKVGKHKEAVENYLKALEIKPNYIEAHNDVAALYAVSGDYYRAMEHYRKAIELKPNFAPLHCNLGIVLHLSRQFAEAIDCFKEALRLDPDYAPAMHELAFDLATAPDPNLRNPEQAVALAERALKMMGEDNVEILEKLAASYAAAGKFELAVATSERALALSPGFEGGKYKDIIEDRLELYREGKAYRNEPRLLKFKIEPGIQTTPNFSF